MKLSFIVAAYNVEDYIQDCLLSMLDLDLDFEYEIIVINDGSKDNTLGKINEILTEKIKVMSITNCGVSKVRNIGIEVALGEYLYFVDGDDIVNKKDFEKITEKIIDDYDIIIGGFNKFDIDNILIPDNLNDIIFDSSGKEILSKYFLNNISPSIWKCFFKKSFLINFNLKFLKSITIAEDGEWFIRAIFFSKSIYYNNNLKIYNYRLRLGSVMLSDYTYKKFIDTLIVIKELMNFIDINNVNGRDRGVFDRYAVSLLCQNFISYSGKIEKKDIREIEHIASLIKFHSLKGLIFLLLIKFNVRMLVIFLKKLN